MNTHFIRIWKNHTKGENSVTTEFLSVKPNPLNKKEYIKPAEGDYAYVYHLRYSNTSRGDKINEPGRGLFCYGKITKVTEDKKQVSISLLPEKKMGYKVFMCEQLKGTTHPEELDKCMSDSCNEGINLLSQGADDFLQKQFNH